jgi:hypothetical protein
MSHENIRGWNARAVQKRVQLPGKVSAGAGVVGVIAETQAGAVVGADAGELRDLGLNFSPRNVGVSHAGIEDYSWRSGTGAVDVQLVSAHVYQFAGYRMKTKVAVLPDDLVIRSSNEDPKRKGQQYAQELTQSAR